MYKEVFIMKLVNDIISTLDPFVDKSIKFYVYLIVFAHVVYVFVFMGMISMNSVYLRELNFAAQAIVCLILIIRFFPLRHHELKKHDPALIFGCSTFLLMNLGFYEYARSYL
jgi:hypothetical protein